MLKIELPYDSEIALLDIYPNYVRTFNQRDACTLMFTVALSIIAKV